jgi:hypothetical protein
LAPSAAPAIVDLAAPAVACVSAAAEFALTASSEALMAAAAIAPSNSSGSYKRRRSRSGSTSNASVSWGFHISDPMTAEVNDDGASDGYETSTTRGGAEAEEEDGFIQRLHLDAATAGTLLGPTAPVLLAGVYMPCLPFNRLYLCLMLQHSRATHALHATCTRSQASVSCTATIGESTPMRYAIQLAATLYQIIAVLLGVRAGVAVGVLGVRRRGLLRLTRGAGRARARVLGQQSGGSGRPRPTPGTGTAA